MAPRRHVGRIPHAAVIIKGKFVYKLHRSEQQSGIRTRKAKKNHLPPPSPLKEGWGGDYSPSPLKEGEGGGDYSLKGFVEILFFPVERRREWRRNDDEQRAPNHPEEEWKCIKGKWNPKGNGEDSSETPNPCWKGTGLKPVIPPFAGMLRGFIIEC